MTKHLIQRDVHPAVRMYAEEAKAGKLGTFILFFVLAFGMLGFIAKAVIQKMWGI